MSADGAVLQGHEISLATRAAWMHFAGGMTQTDVAARLGITRLKAHRLIARASQTGLVRVFIDGEIAECVQLETALSTRYGLTYCEVVPNLDGDAFPIDVLGMAGAQFLQNVLERGEDTLIGVGHGRTLAASVDRLIRLPSVKARFVSLLGGLTRKFAANPHDVVHRLADRTGAEAYMLPVPFTANSVADREVLMAQRGIAEVFEMARQASLHFVGIGTVEWQASLVATGMIERGEIDEVKREGGCGEMLGRFFDRNGQPVETDLGRRTLSVGLDDIRRGRTVAVAGGAVKVDAIRAVLASGHLQGLITDERTAAKIIEAAGPIPAGGSAGRLDKAR